MRIVVVAVIAAVLGVFASYGIYAAAQPKVAQSNQSLFDYGSR
jgi:hypothetical protein